jgi:signal transduction histidine kinase
MRPGEPAAPEPTAELALAALERAQPFVIDDVEADEELFEPQRRLLAAHGFRSGFAYPIGWGERMIGAVGVAGDGARVWEREALPLLERLAPQVAAALAQAEAFAQQQRTIAALESLNEQRQRLVATVSHELRTPVTATLGFLETLLLRAQLSEDDRRRFLHEAAAGARRLARLVDDLLVLTRTERRTLPVIRERLEPNRLLEQVLAGLIVPDGRAVTFRSDGDCAVAGDPDRLLQVLANLLSNAIAHGRGEISVSCHQQEGRVTIAVADDGPNLPKAEIEQLFVPFARFGKSEGSGLGLAIARGLAEAHGGSLHYRPAQGAEKHAFVLELPAADSPDRTLPEPASHR